MNKSVLLWFKHAVSASRIEVKQELKLKIFAKAGSRAGAWAKLFRAGVESKSKTLDSDHLWFTDGTYTQNIGFANS